MFKKHFGERLLACPDARLETVVFGSTMHGVEAGVIVSEINEIIKGSEEG